MVSAARILVPALLLGAFAGMARADGKFFPKEQIPPDIPYQRAFLVFHDGREMLLVQSKYEIANSAATDALGWIVPVPAVPELASIDADVAESFFIVASMQTRPDVFRVSSLFGLINLLLFLGSIAFLVICGLEYPFLQRIGLAREAWARRVRWAVVAVFVFFMLTAASMPMLTLAGGSVEVVKEEEVGIYDVKVIRADDAQAILDWLTGNGFRYDQEDTETLKDYVRRGWCFVTAKAEPEPGTRDSQIASEGMVAPLILTFETEAPVYPLALTATASASTELLIYTLSQNKLTCGDRLTLRRARPIVPSATTRYLLVPWAMQESPFLAGLPDKPMTLCKFKDRLTAAEMREDLRFERATDNEPYAETKIVW